MQKFSMFRKRSGTESKTEMDSTVQKAIRILDFVVHIKLQEDHNGADCHCDPLCFTFDFISEIPCGNPP